MEPALNTKEQSRMCIYCQRHDFQRERERSRTENISKAWPQMYLREYLCLYCEISSKPQETSGMGCSNTPNIYLHAVSGMTNSKWHCVSRFCSINLQWQLPSGFASIVLFMKLVWKSSVQSCMHVFALTWALWRWDSFKIMQLKTKKKKLFI